MDIDTLTLLSIGASLLTIGTILFLLLAVRTMIVKDSSVDNRLNAYLQKNENESFLVEDGPILSDRINNALSNQSFSNKIRLEIEQANIRLTVPEYILIRIAAPLIVGIAGLFIGKSLISLGAGIVIGIMLPGFWMNSRKKRRYQDFNDQLAETLTLVVGSLRGGFSLIQSLGNTAKESPEPTKSELLRVAQEVQIGVSLSQALDNLVMRLSSEDLDLVVTAIKINMRVGGNLTSILETISATIRERAKLRREVRVITSMQRISSYVIGLLPVGLAGVIFLINPTYMMRLFQPGIFLCIPIGAAVSSAIGFFIIQKIIDIKV